MIPEYKSKKQLEKEAKEKADAERKERMDAEEEARRARKEEIERKKAEPKDKVAEIDELIDKNFSKRGVILSAVPRTDADLDNLLDDLMNA